MAIGAEIATAFVRIRPNLSGFKGEVTAGIKGALSEVQSEVAASTRANVTSTSTAVRANYEYAGSYKAVATAAQEVVPAATAAGAAEEKAALGAVSMGRSAEHAEGRLAKLRERLLNVGTLFGVGFGAVELVKFVKEITGGAASVQKSAEVIKSSFGPAASQVLVKFGDTTAAKLGISAELADKTSARFGILFKNLGIGQPVAATMTKNLESLAGSLSMIRGVDPSKALSQITLAMLGNVRSLKQLGLAVDPATVKIEAFKLGLIDQVKDALSPAARAQAIYALSIQHLGSFQALAAKHSNDYASAQFRLAAEWSNAKDVLGTDLLPTFASYTGRLADWLHRMIESGSLQRDLNHDLKLGGELFRGVRDALSPVVDGLRGLVDVAGGAKRAGEILLAVWSVRKILAIGGAVRTVSLGIRAALVATGWGALAVAAGVAAVYIVTHWEKVKRWFREFYAYLRAAHDATFVAFKQGAKQLEYVLVWPFAQAELKLLQLASHIPGLTKTANRATAEVRRELDQMRPDWGKVKTAWAAGYASVGLASGQAFLKGFSKAYVSKNPSIVAAEKSLGSGSGPPPVLGGGTVLPLLNDASITWTFGGDGSIYAMRNDRVAGVIRPTDPFYDVYARRARLSEARQRALARQGHAAHEPPQAHRKPPAQSSSVVGDDPAFKALMATVKGRIATLRKADDTARDNVKAANRNLADAIAAGRFQIEQARQAVRAAQQTLADTIRQGHKAVNDAVVEAKQNLNSIGDQIASAVNDFLDKLHPHGLTGRGSPEIRAEMKRLKAELSAGVTGPGLQQQARELTSRLQVAPDADALLQKEKDRVTRQLAGLTDLYNRHLLSRAGVEKRLTALLKREHLTRAELVKKEGIAAADQFDALLTGFRQQLNALAAGPRGKGNAAGSGLVPQIVRPLEALKTSQRADAHAAQAVRVSQRNLQRDELSQSRRIRVATERIAKAMAKLATADTKLAAEERRRDQLIATHLARSGATR